MSNRVQRKRQREQIEMFHRLNRTADKLIRDALNNPAIGTGLTVYSIRRAMELLAENER